MATMSAPGSAKPMGVTVMYKRASTNPAVFSPVLETEAVEPDILSQRIGIPLELPFKLGIPLRYRHEYDYVGAFMGTSGWAECPNEMIHLLTINCNIHSKDFGEPYRTKQNDRQILLSRIDGKDLEVKQVEALEAFMKSELADLVALQQLDREDEDEAIEFAVLLPKAKAAAAEKITPEYFAAFFEKYRQEQAASDPAWLVVECPVKDGGGPFCKTCGKNAKDAGAPLLKCGRCKKFAYCGKECQKDWALHKKWDCAEILI